MAGPNRRYKKATTKPRPCTECAKRPTCTELCKTVEEWVSQDEVGQGADLLSNMREEFREGLTWLDIIGRLRPVQVDLDSDAAEDAWNRVMKMNLPPQTIEVIDLYYKQAIRQCEIARILGISDQAVDTRRKSALNAVKDRLERDRVYNTVRYITFKDKSRIDEIIQMYFVEYLEPKQIAERLGMSVNSIHVQVARVLSMEKMLDTGPTVGGV